MTSLESWVGKTKRSTAVLAIEQANLMNATLDRLPHFQAGDVLPPAWHWLYFHEPVRRSDLGGDGHARLGDFMPPVPLPRRMWAGGHLAFERPLFLGEAAEKRSTIASITPKSGRTGELFFVELTHEIWQRQARCQTETQTLVYRQSHRPDEPVVEPQPAPTDPQFTAAYLPDAVMLFRYSALTFNGHRIHYDREYCRQHEGYPDLVVHGPLVAALLLDLFYHFRERQMPGGFAYRARAPLFAGRPFSVNGRLGPSGGRGWAADDQGFLTMTAEVSD